MNLQRNFEQSATEGRGFHELLQHCSGWIAHFAVWTTEQPPQKIAVTDIDLDASEVELQMHQTMWLKVKPNDTWLKDERKAGTGDWRMQFPMSISIECHKISILRTVYSMRLQRFTSTAHVGALQLPVSEDAYLWSVQDLRDKHEAIHDDAFALLARCRRLDLCLYWIRISPQGDFLIRMEQELYKPHVATIFELFKTRTGRDVAKEIIRYQPEHYEGPEQLERRFLVAFHPAKQAIVYSIARQVYFWFRMSGRMYHPTSL